jgi:hypothetical protein
MTIKGTYFILEEFKGRVHTHTHIYFFRIYIYMKEKFKNLQNEWFGIWGICGSLL